MILLIKLILAHLLGDFLLQPASWVKAKVTRKLKAYQLYVHALLHGVLIMILIWDWIFLPWALLLAFIHFVIDATKLLLQRESNRSFYFFADQFAHIISIYLIFCWHEKYTQIDTSIFNENNYLLATILIFLNIPSSLIIKMFITRWTPHTEDKTDDSLEDAGKFIGILERLFVFIFVISGHWEAVGFLLAAKSVFRFGDLKESKDRKLTEYILIGTLLSFGIAILAGIVYNELLSK